MLSNFIKRIWGTKNEPLSSATDLAYIKFSVDTNFNIHFSCDWQTLDPSVANVIGKLLYDLNKGLYSDPILQHLTSRGLNKIEETSFIRSIFNKWSELTSVEEIIDSKPLIQPSVAFFKNAKYKT